MSVNLWYVVYSHRYNVKIFRYNYNFGKKDNENKYF